MDRNCFHAIVSCIRRDMDSFIQVIRQLRRSAPIRTFMVPHIMSEDGFGGAVAHAPSRMARPFFTAIKSFRVETDGRMQNSLALLL